MATSLNIYKHVNTMEKKYTWIDKVFEAMMWFGAALFAFAMLAVCTEVVMRYFFNRPIAWILEICEYILLYMTFLVAAWVLREQSHIRVDIVINHLDPRIQAFIGMIASIISAMVCLTIVYFSALLTWDYIREHVPSMEYLKLPAFLIIMIIPFGSLLFAIQFMRDIQTYFQCWRSPAKD
jgi:C4-dicarboxylate transporter DctQ subunit